MSDLILTEYGKVSSKLSVNALNKICVEKDGVQTGPFGTQLHKEDYVATGTPIITVEHLDSGFINGEDAPLVTDEDKHRLIKYTLRKGDIVFSRVGSVDRRSLVREKEDGWLFSGRCLRVRSNQSIIDPRFLSYFFGTESFKTHIRSIAVGATMPSINTKILSDVRVFYPPLPEQKAIAHILGSLDDKIELNRQMNQTLEAMAQALFKSWFVDFDPVMDNALAVGNEIPDELLAMAEKRSLVPDNQKLLFKNPELAALFPSSFVFNETLGKWIPEGWEIKKFEDVSNQIIRGFTTNYVEKSRLINLNQKVNKGDILEKQHFKYYPEDSEVPKEKFARKKDILMNSLGQGTLGRVHYYYENTDNVVVDQHITIIRVKYGQAFYYQYLKSQEGNERLMSRITGSTGMLMLNVNVIRNFEVPFPTDDLLFSFQKETDVFYSKITHCISEIEVLINLRDTLLPELISGKVRVNEIQVMNNFKI